MCHKSLSAQLPSTRLKGANIEIKLHSRSHHKQPTQPPLLNNKYQLKRAPTYYGKLKFIKEKTNTVKLKQ